jgi:hypothetical protein
VVTLLALQSLPISWVCAAMPQPVLLLAIFLWGFAWSLPFYIPAGVMALQLGGPEHAALLTNIFDAAGFLVAVSPLAMFPATMIASEGFVRVSILSLSFSCP